MMSATTAFTETPAATPAAPASTAAGTSAGTGATDEFQSLLAGAVVDGSQCPLAETLAGQTAPLAPGQTIAQLFAQKSAPVRAQPPPAAPHAVPTEATAGEMLDLLEQSAALLPDAGGVDASLPEEVVETREALNTDDDILSDWLNVIIPYSVLAQQAGSGPADANAHDGGGASAQGELGIPSSLQRQAGNPDAAAPAVAPTAPAATVVTLERAPVAAQATAAAAAAANLAPSVATTETRERAATGDEWMNAFGDPAVRRAHDSAPTLSLRVSTPVHDARWADALAHRLVMLAREGETVAQLRLVPQELGPLDIQISVRDGEASIHFGAANAETRTALESSLPRLRELLSAQGLQLANASVSHQSAGSKTPERAPAVNAVGSVSEEPETASAKVVSTSLLDIYA